MLETACHTEGKAPAILVVDDDRSVCDAFSMQLTRLGYGVKTAGSHTEAENLLRDQVFDAIISDIFLGDKDGLDILEQSHRLQPDTPVILVTGLPTVETASAAVHLDAFEYLRKPVPMETLATTVARAVELKSLRLVKKRLARENENYQRDLEQLVAARTEKLIQSNQRYHLLFENSKDAIYMASREGEFLALNASAVHLFGHEREELMQVNALSLYADPDRYRQLCEEIEENGFVKDFGVQFKQRDGAVIDCLLTAHLLIDADGHIEGYQGIIRDITEQKKSDQKIRTQNVFLTSVIESLAHPFMVIDAADFKVKIANAAARRNKKTQDATCYALNHGYDAPCSQKGLGCPVEQVVETKRPVHLEHVHNDAQGRECEHEVHAFPLLDNGGRVKQVIQYCIDITEKKRLEAIAEAANLMDNLGFIFAGIRHEIGNPLNSVKMALSVLSMNLDRYSPETVREFVDRAMGEVLRVEYLLKALKNFSMFETPDVEPVHMGRFMNNFKALVETDFAAKGVRIHVQMPTQPVFAITDHRAFHQVMLNLLTNAADALEEQDTPRIDIDVTPMSGFIQIQVKDNGCGMSEEGRHNLFRPFYTSKPQGTGLGLVIVKKMLSKMNGTVRVDSVLHKGTTVTMTLPEGTNQERDPA